MLSPQALSSPSISSFDGEWGVQLRHTLSGVNLSQDVWIMISSLCNVDPHRYWRPCTLDENALVSLDETMNIRQYYWEAHHWILLMHSHIYSYLISEVWVPHLFYMCQVICIVPPAFHWGLHVKWQYLNRYNNNWVLITLDITRDKLLWDFNMYCRRVKHIFLTLHSLIWVHFILPDWGDLREISPQKPFEFKFVKFDFFKFEFAFVV